MHRINPTCLLVAFTIQLLLEQHDIRGADWPMLGRDGTRNGVSSETSPPTVWCVEEQEGDRLIRGPHGIRWSAPLGSMTFSSPVVSSGLVWIGTNDLRPGARGGQARCGVLKCFRTTDGRQVYEYVAPNLPRLSQHPGYGLGGSPLIEGDRLWLTTNRCEVLCLDISPLLRGAGPPRELWKVDLVKKFDVFLHVPAMGPPHNCSIGPSWNGRIFVTIRNSVGDDFMTVPKPNAPSLVCLSKDTGELFWQDSSPGDNILMTQMADPSVVKIRGEYQVIVPQSDGWVRAFNPQNGEKLWEFDMNPKAAIHKLDGLGQRNSLLGNAVVYEDRVYIASGQDPQHGEGPGRLVCIDPTRRGDVSSELAVDAHGKLLSRRRVQGVDPKFGEKAVPNPNSALVWEFAGPTKDFADAMHRALGSVVIAKGLLIAADLSGVVHCLDAKTGQRYWNHDINSAIWASPLIVDDKVYVGDEDGKMSVYQLGADAKCAEPIAVIPHGNYHTLYSSPAYADGTLYVATRDTLFAVDTAAARRWQARTGNWPRWRGPYRDNRSSDTGLLNKWPAAGPPLAWRVDGLGEGIASVALADGRVFTTTTYGENEFAVALDEETGQRLWATRIGAAIEENPLMRWLSQRTPTVDGNRLYVFTNTGWLACLDAISGEVEWRTQYLSEFGTTRGTWGFCDRPLVDGDKLICAQAAHRPHWLRSTNGRARSSGRNSSKAMNETNMPRLYWCKRLA